IQGPAFSNTLACMATSDGSMVTAGSIALGLIGFFTTPTLIAVRKSRSRSRNGYEELEKLYEDEDGTATEASAKTFSAALPIYLILGSTILGLCLSTTTAIQSTARTYFPASDVLSNVSMVHSLAQRPFSSS
ncbi:MAG: hypothetical protein Q9166_007564, partial [cf. Caloplaca sp. 2 TL-2023]